MHGSLLVVKICKCIFWWTLAQNRFALLGLTCSMTINPGHSPNSHSGLKDLFFKVLIHSFRRKKWMSLFLETCTFSVLLKGTALLWISNIPFPCHGQTATKKWCDTAHWSFLVLRKNMWKVESSKMEISSNLRECNPLCLVQIACWIPFLEEKRRMNQETALRKH